jgi:hypothetical protein
MPATMRNSQWRRGCPRTDIVQRSWTALARDFVAEIEGRAHGPYFSIADGWRHQEVIDGVRARRGWLDLPREP